jgi:hypothetical protein
VSPPTESVTTEGAAAGNSLDLTALFAVALLVVGFTFSDDVVEFLCDITGNSQAANAPWLIFLFDMLLVLATAALKWRISGGTTDPRTFLRRLLTGWWAAGAGLAAIAHPILIATADWRAGLGDTASVWISLLASMVFVAAMTLLLLSALGEGTSSRGWIVPLVIGTAVVQIATALWYPVIDIERGCGGDVSPSYFSEMANILAVVLLTLGVEMNFVRRSAGARDVGQRVAPVLTVILLCIGLALSFSMLVKADLGKLCGLAATWHQYIAFAVSAQALAVGLATLVWLMLVDAVDADDPPRVGNRADDGDRA